ncbi:2,3-diaminopropionate biosynthesis protein SbnB [Deinococcus roseus]|uniref:2,3-diaminopropionate biosynthesis protein SbnB n=2 Tax=Deinococcus roseus TaxID=392414 RepID=A0ABQ2DBK2_9DEIO|nr:2,3-diaminopropionate biosynthesis protein SbnB [Deinococcus roseus]
MTFNPHSETAPTPSLRVLSGPTVQDLLKGQEVQILQHVQAAYEHHQQHDSALPHSLFLRFPEQPRDRIIALPAFLGGGIQRAGIKWIASFPGNHQQGLDRASAVMVLNSPRTGLPEAFLEGSIISMKRTAASAALAAKHLQGHTPQGVALVGCGPINFETLRFLRTVFPDVQQALVYDTLPERAAGFKKQAEELHAGLHVQVAQDLAEVWQSDWVISFATTALDPHVSSLPADLQRATILNVSLRDFTPEVLEHSENIVDDLDHVLRANTSPHLLELKLGHRDFIRGTLAQVTLGEIPARAQENSVVMFSPFGLGILDLAVADLVLTRAETLNLGTLVPDFLPPSGLKG